MVRSNSSVSTLAQRRLSHLEDDDSSTIVETNSSQQHRNKGRRAGSGNTRESISPGLAKHETYRIKRIRSIVALVLVASTIGIAMAIYFFVRNSERNDYEHGYQSDTNRILDGMGLSIHDSISAMSSFSTMMIAFAQQSNQTFPYFSMPLFGVKASKLLTQTTGFCISVQTVVTSEQRLEWEAYTMQQQWWVNETKMIQEMDQFYFDEVPYGTHNRPRIFNYTHELPYEPK
jgi:hypothetical protein